MSNVNATSSSMNPLTKVEEATELATSNAGRNITEVHEKIVPAVVHETKKHIEENKITTVIDKEIHQDHYHTTIQPIQDVQVLPEQHTQNVAAVQERTFDARNDSEIRARLEQERTKFQDMTIEGEKIRTTQMSPTVVGEHVVHHLHETIQPVVQRETIETTVVHTVVPVHEVHHSAAEYHSASALPAITMEQFKTQGGSLSGRAEVIEKFEGVPAGFDTKTGDSGSVLTGSNTAFSGNNTSSSKTGGILSTASPTSAGGLTGSRSDYDNTTGSSTGLTGNTSSTTGRSGVSSPTTDNSTTTHKKPSLMDRINPKIDADGDGKAGFMS